mmetsp:Transcript_13311/g.13106  ORF Transcript_13311/g.13106 Transcript_13311/m.13106 type:complete len:131 (+) Transcript_13311:1295-1687(+)
MQRKLKEEDLKMLQSISNKVEMKRLDSIYSQGPKFQQKSTMMGSKVAPEKNKKRKIDYGVLMKANMNGIFDLKVLNGEHNLVELYEQYSQKCGIYDDNAKLQALKLKDYRSNLDLIDRKLVQGAAIYYNL